MKKKILIVLGILTGIFILGLIFYFFAYRVTDIAVWQGKFFDDSEKQLGFCKIEGKMRALADIAEEITYYYDLNQNYIGHCEGGVFDGAGCMVSLKEEPKICDPISLQKICDKSIYPIGFGATAKYRCVL